MLNRRAGYSTPCRQSLRRTDGCEWCAACFGRGETVVHVGCACHGGSASRYIWRTNQASEMAHAHGVISMVDLRWKDYLHGPYAEEVKESFK